MGSKATVSGRSGAAAKVVTRGDLLRRLKRIRDADPAAFEALMVLLSRLVDE